MSDIEQIPVTLTVNGKKVQRFVEPRTLLIHFLREELNLTGPHIGCETSHCGACTVDMDGKSVKACTVFAAQANGAEITTIEGMANPDGTLLRFRKASASITACNAAIARPGMITAGAQAFAGKPEPDRRGCPHRHRRQSVPLHRLPEHRQGDLSMPRPN
jgi:carbon-monoxide dehydrogenase small subunit